jgi:hypothetical protein
MRMHGTKVKIPDANYILSIFSEILDPDNNSLSEYIFSYIGPSLLLAHRGVGCLEP